MAPDQPETVSLYQPMDQESLSLDSSFTFLCHPDLPCFNQCCPTPTVILSPYDLLRLKQGLGITSTALRQRYTQQEIEPNSNLPLVFIDAFRSPEGGCPFLGESGCTVYPYRPAACRLFPLTMGSRLTPDGVEDHYFCRRLDYCQGFNGAAEWAAASWMADQGFTEYDQGRREWLEILLKAGLTEELVVDDLVQDLFATLAYDLDRSRRLVFDPVSSRPIIQRPRPWKISGRTTWPSSNSVTALATLLSPAGSKDDRGYRRSTGFFEVD